MPKSRSIQPVMKNNPPIGVMGPIKGNMDLFIAFSDAIAYNDPEKKAIPAKKNIPAYIIKLF